MKSRQDEVFGLKTAALSVQSNLLGGFLKVSAKITGPRLSLKATVSFVFSTRNANDAELVGVCVGISVL